MSLWGSLKKTVKRVAKGGNLMKGTPFEGISRAVGKSARKAASAATGGMSEAAIKGTTALAKGAAKKKAKGAAAVRATAATPLAANAPVSAPPATVQAAPSSGGIIGALLRALGLG